ncbi:MerR family DNA-binding transcriptional regulator [Streptomyces sp. NPDC005386]
MTSSRISQLAERCDVPATTLRFYEEAGLLPADRPQPDTGTTARTRWSG